jgi:PAS domain S-box-containing protein
MTIRMKDSSRSATIAQADTPASPSHRRMKSLFLCLACFQLLLIGASLFESYRLQHFYLDAVASQELWNGRRQQIAELDRLAASSSVPTMEDFNSDLWEQGQQTMHYGASIFATQVDMLADELDHSPDAQSRSMASDARSLRELMQATLDQADQAVKSFQSGNREQFEAQMIYADRAYRRVLLTLGALSKSASEFETNDLNQQSIVAARVRNWSFALVIVAGLLVLALVGYAWQLNRQLQSDETSLRRERETLEQRVSERTAELQNEIIEKKNAEALIRKNEAHLADAQRIAHLGSWEWDVQSGEMYWSDETYRLLGLMSQSTPPTFASFLLALMPEDREQIRQRMEESLAMRKPLKTECRIQRTHGVERVLLVQGEAEYDEQQRPKRMTGFALDISERKRAQKLIEREAKLVVDEAMAHRRLSHN